MSYNPVEKLDTESKHVERESIKVAEDDLNEMGKTSTRRNPRSYRKRSEYEKLIQAFLLLLFLVALHYIHSRHYFSCNVKHSNAQDQTTSLHFSTPRGTHSAPFGLFIDDDKTRHMYFQSALDSSRTTNCASWGHATSSDLYTWRIQPIAFQDDDIDMCDGSVVVDANNTSGFFPRQSNGVVALYTQYHRATGSLQISIAYSVDGGYTFTRSSKNTVLRGFERAQDSRHPKVIWHAPSRQWIMTIATANHSTISIYTSPNLLEWALASDIIIKDPAIATHGLDFPALLPIPRMNSTGAENPNWPTVPGGTVKNYGDYILFASSPRGSPLNGGSIIRYFPGIFNGTHFQPRDTRTDTFMDFGPDNYASQFFFGTSEGAPVISVGIATNLGSTTSLQTNTLTLPRESYLIPGPGEGDLSLLSRPVNLPFLRDDKIASLSAHNISGTTVSYSPSDAILIDAKFEMQPPDDEHVEIAIDFIFKSSTSAGHVLCTVVFGTWTADLGCDRSQAKTGSTTSLEAHGLDRMAAWHVRPLLPFHNPAVRRWEVQIILDRGILEIFMNGGVRAGTMGGFEALGVDRVEFRSRAIPAWASLGVDVQRLSAQRQY